MAIDADRYRREVLDPARRAGNRPPDDLVARYQLIEPLSPAGVREQVEAALAHWHKQKASLAYRKVIDALEADHRRLQPLFASARDGDPRPLQAEIEAARVRRRTRGATLRGELTSLAGTLGMLLPDVLEQMAGQGYDPAEVQATTAELRIEVRAPDTLPIEAPVRGFAQLRENLATLDCRHIADFLFGREALSNGFSVLDGFSVAGRSLYLDDDAVRATAAGWAKRLEGKSVPEAVLAALRRLSPDERAALLVFECAYELRTWRDLRADSAALEQRALDLGLLKRDAQRFAFAVGSERGAGRSLLASQLEELLSERRVIRARLLVSGLGDGIPEDCTALAEQATRLGERALELQRQAQASTDADTGWRLLDEAVHLASDLSDVDYMRRQWPPQPPRSVVASLEGGVVTVRWTPSLSSAGPLVYRVRRLGSPDLVAETAATSAEDPSPPVNVACAYSVVASREGVQSASVHTGQIWYRPEVLDLSVAQDDGQVTASWRLPAGAGRVAVVRGESPPSSTSDGSAVQAAPDGFTDRSVRDGVTYHYLVAVSYVGPDGTEVLTRGLRFTGASVKPPTPVSRLVLEPLADEPGFVLARFATPPAGTVVLRALPALPPPPGARLPASVLPGLPCPGVPVAGGLKCQAPAHAAVLVAITVSGERAVVGDHAEWVPPTAPPVVIAQRRGEGVHLSWDWPRDVVEMEVRWRADASPWQSMVVSAARYGADGGVHLPRQGDRTEIMVAAVTHGVDRRLVGPASRLLVAAPASGAYTVTRTGFRRRAAVATVTVNRPVVVPRLVLLAGSGDFLPLRSTDGQVLAEVSNVDIAPGRPAILRAAIPGGVRWLRCFAPGDVVELRDPPREQLRVGS
jgi:hypothetical protein